MDGNGSRRPWALIALVVGIGVVLFLLFGGHSSGTPGSVATTTTPTTTPGQTTVPPPPTTVAQPSKPAASVPVPQPHIAGPDPNVNPAIQHLPFTGMGLQISISNSEPDGKIDLYVYSDSLTVAQEQAAYPGFLALYGDPGTGYIPTYASALTGK